MRPTWGPSGADRTQVGPMLAPWTLLSGRAKVYSSASLRWVRVNIHPHHSLSEEPPPAPPPHYPTPQLHYHPPPPPHSQTLHHLLLLPPPAPLLQRNLLGFLDLEHLNCKQCMHKQNCGVLITAGNVVKINNMLGWKSKRNATNEIKNRFQMLKIPLNKNLTTKTSKTAWVISTTNDIMCLGEKKIVNVFHEDETGFHHNAFDNMF